MPAISNKFSDDYINSFDMLGSIYRKYLTSKTLFLIRLTVVNKALWRIFIYTLKQMVDIGNSLYSLYTSLLCKSKLKARYLALIFAQCTVHYFRNILQLNRINENKVAAHQLTIMVG